MFLLSRFAVLAAVLVPVLAGCGADQAKSTSPRTVVEATNAGDAANKGPVDPAFAPDRLRVLDPCALLQAVLPRQQTNTEATPNGDVFADCFVLSYPFDGGQKLNVTLTIGKAVPEAGRDAGELVGIRVIESQQSTRCAEKAVTQNSPPLGIVLEVDSLGTSGSSAAGQLCDPTKKMLTTILQRIHTGPPTVSSSGTAASVDPCTLADKATLDKVVGPAPSVGVDSLRDCSWRQNGLSLEVALSIEQDQAQDTAASGKPGKPVDIGSGVTAYQVDTNNGAPGCAIAWWLRNTGSTNETATVRFTNLQNVAGVDSCANAMAAAKVVATKLPKS
ncbi:MAG: hypothetical protein JOZ47_02020 [Kutzneria sp.]|nr:hypothetical protein [Kutzneria sp.]